MTELMPGSLAPDFTLPTDNGGEITLSSLRGRKVVLFFYPKDDTPGCTAEACAFRDTLPQFECLKVKIIGISRCSPRKHDRFKSKYALNYPLASDETGQVCEKYGVIQEKTMFGRKFMGIERSTFLIDEHGHIQALWRNVSVPGHVDNVRAALTDNRIAA